MGCDIHLHVEVKVKGKWEHYSTPHINRYYALFEKMAGVRGSLANAIAAPRGFPDDASEITKLDKDYWDDDGHTYSWLSADEVNTIEKWYDEEYKRVQGKYPHPPVFHYLSGNGVGCKQSWPDWVEDSRVVFWFDN